MPPRVVEAVPPCPTPKVPARRLKPMEEVATTEPCALVARSWLVVPSRVSELQTLRLTSWEVEEA
jgi:hypothetical protein